MPAAGLEPATYGCSIQLSFTRTESAAGLEPAAYRRSIQLSSTQTKIKVRVSPRCRTVLAGNPRRGAFGPPLGAALVGWCQTMNMAG